MRKSLLVLATSVALMMPAAAQVNGPVYVPLGYQQQTSLASAVSLTNIPVGATFASICVDVAGVRWRDDGTAPTATIGMQIPAGTCLPYSGTLSKIQFIQATAGAILNVSYYR